MMELYKGRPADADSRLPREQRVYDCLDSLGLTYYRTDHAPAETMEDCKAVDELEYLDIQPGAVSVMGLMNDAENGVTLLIDEDLLHDEFIGCHPCVNTSSLKLCMKDVLETFLPAVRHGYTTVKLVGC